MYMCTYIYIYIYIYARTHLHLYLHTYILTYIYTYICTKGLATSIPVVMVSKRSYGILVGESYSGAKISFDENGLVNSTEWEILEKYFNGEGWPRSDSYITKKYEDELVRLSQWPDRLETMKEAYNKLDKTTTTTTTTTASTSTTSAPSSGEPKVNWFYIFSWKKIIILCTNNDDSTHTYYHDCLQQ